MRFARRKARGVPGSDIRHKTAPAAGTKPRARHEPVLRSSFRERIGVTFLLENPPEHRLVPLPQSVALSMTDFGSPTPAKHAVHAGGPPKIL